MDVVILAAGKGTRMNSTKPKVMHRLAGKPLLDHVIETAKKINPTQVIIVVGHEEAAIREHYATTLVTFVSQKQQLGTGHAVAQAIDHLTSSKTLILMGDVPCVREESIQQLTQCDADVVVLTQIVDDPTGYGRILRTAAGRPSKIVEEKDANPNEKLVLEINTGIFCVNTELLKKFLSTLKNSNAKGEYYLTDLIEFASRARASVETVQPSLDFEANGVNSKRQLAELERRYQLELAHELMESGVTISDPRRIDIRGTLACDTDVSIDVGCVFEGEVHLGKNVTIEANVIIKDSVIKDGTTIRAFSHIEGGLIGSQNEIGPYARIRPGTESQTQVKIGNFVEVKAVTIGAGSKANHLAYLGDAKIGSSVNVGAGTITCNYDGANKHQTTLEDNVFIGSDTQLIAPVTIGAGSTVAAGSTITKDVPPGGLALSRVKQTFIADWKRPTKTKSTK
ncbi:MAG: bifunctional UDP-N-acetylglucosamine diphosphorylase/glucosamine-1-phosphate N-acetyltransferase GlmU [Proteobacteria bacterium]|nr:bifunctional UDP-N-acetylglucosamine diphosphorylase/glucosamine-1-phosphate N-acetyltransferase GlmU [Pseudomonadota bacterium]